MKLKWKAVLQKGSSRILSHQDPVSCFQACLNNFREYLRNLYIPGMVPSLATSLLGWAGYLEILTSEDIETLNETFQEGIEAEALFTLLCLVEELYRV